MIVHLLMILIIATSLVAIWYGVGAIARMRPDTRLSIRIAFIAKTTGLAAIVAAVVDYYLGDPFAWPWLMLGGVALANAGTAGIYIVNRRSCRCPECPVRRIVILQDSADER